jgi:hypothetical protein
MRAGNGRELLDQMQAFEKEALRRGYIPEGGKAHKNTPAPSAAEVLSANDAYTRAEAAKVYAATAKGGHASDDDYYYDPIAPHDDAVAPRGANENNSLEQKIPVESITYEGIRGKDSKTWRVKGAPLLKFGLAMYEEVWGKSGLPVPRVDQPIHLQGYVAIHNGKKVLKLARE